MTLRISIAAFLLTLGMLVVPTNIVSVQGKSDRREVPPHMVAAPPASGLTVGMADGGGGDPDMAPPPTADPVVVADGGGGDPDMAPPPRSERVA